MRRYKYINKFVDLKLNKKTCINCNTCIEVCPHGVFENKEGKVFIENPEYCMGCGACINNCPVNALSANTGVGCAAAVFYSRKNNGEVSCDCCSEDDSSSCCG